MVPFDYWNLFLMALTAANIFLLAAVNAFGGYANSNRILRMYSSPGFSLCDGNPG